MGISSRRGMRSIFSRKKNSPYSPMKGDGTNAKEAIAPLSVLSSVTTASDFESAQALDMKQSQDNIIICTNTGSGIVQEDEKVSDEDLVCSQDAAIELARNASAMTELVAQRMALVSTRSFTSNFENTLTVDGQNGYNAGEEKTDFEENGPIGEASVAESSCHQNIWICGDNLVQTTNTKANTLLEASILSGKEMMELAEVSSQSAIEKRLPLSPLLERASERVETAFLGTIEEAHEFFLDHWTMLQRFVAARKSKNSATSSIGNVEAENLSPSVSVEVQIKTTE
eukprot:CAMPEP_0116141978 /NCGR_PEP_ID=MMETSP0329-20121206/14663_1 /TAXON_ID=697910 /ORGANISM="Pseudo-nitzschia arenysensis, Strain B593" /LENGTH=284 /DNA_ID=CAMNT_0003637183 /DNA_START=94 /DNA_END=948 /DNA_ORIENTATION=+